MAVSRVRNMVLGVMTTEKDARREGGYLQKNKMQKAIYGKVSVQRTYCPYCKGMAWVQDGHYACCDNLVRDEPKNGEIVFMIPNEVKRKNSTHLTNKEKIAILESQDYKCAYCECSLRFKDKGELSFHGRAGKQGLPQIVANEVAFDHFIPWEYIRSHHRTEFFAACKVCNSIKSKKIFDTLEQARQFIQKRRERKGIVNL